MFLECHHYIDLSLEYKQSSRRFGDCSKIYSVDQRIVRLSMRQVRIQKLKSLWVIQIMHGKNWASPQFPLSKFVVEVCRVL